MRISGLFCCLFESIRSCQQFWTFRGSSNCNVNFIASCLFVFWSCPFEASSWKVQNVSALLSPVDMLLSHHRATLVRMFLLCEVLRTSPWRNRCNRSTTNLNTVRVLIFCPCYHIWVVCQVRFITCKTVCIGKRCRRDHFALARITDAQQIAARKNLVEFNVACVFSTR